MNPREQAAAIKLLERWLKQATDDKGNARGPAPSLERVRLVDATKEFLATSNLEDVE